MNSRDLLAMLAQAVKAVPQVKRHLSVNARYLLCEKHTPGGVDHNQQNHAGGNGGSGGVSYREFTSARDMASFGDSFTPSNLPSGETDSLAFYKSEGYGDINALLRSGEYGDYESQIKDIDSAISKSVIPEDVQVFRGISLDMFGDDGIGEGDEFSDNGFVSTSMSFQVASNFTNDDAYMVINVPKGSNGIYTDSQNLGFDAGREEFELLLPRGSSFVVDSIDENDDGSVFVNVTLKRRDE